MNIRNLIFSSVCFCMPVLLMGQTLDDVKLDFTHERYFKAERGLHALIDRKPANPEAWLWLTRCYLVQDKIEKGRDTLVLAPSSLQREPYLLIAKGALLMEENKVAEAKSLFQLVEKNEEKNSTVLQAMADVNTASLYGDAAYAIQLLQKAMKRDKKNADLNISLGRAYRKLHDGSLSYQSFNDALDKDPKAAVAYYELGQLFRTQRNTDLYIDFFQKAIQADGAFGPAYYELYDHYLYLDAAKAREYFQKYAANADPSLQLDYSYTDLLYLNRNYDSSIIAARKLIDQEGQKVQPRIYKLVAYSFEGRHDTAAALQYMRQYFKNENDTNLVVKDFEMMSALYAREGGKEDSAIIYLSNAVALAKEGKTKAEYYRQLAALSKKINDFQAEARWLGELYAGDARASNLTLFNWGLAAYKAKDYKQADSVFGIYTSKYPTQGFGYYWRARANAAIDTLMTLGLAVPHYQKLLEVMDKDSLSDTDKKWMKESYGYLAGYEANTNKDYRQAIDYFEKVLEIDPANDQATKYIGILEKNLEAKNKEGEEKVNK
jgi:tetratricopeptide (TPR) repeat protein